MDPFISLPDELLLKICNDMDIKTLSDVIKASSRVYQVCSTLLKRKHEKDLIENIIHHGAVTFRKSLTERDIQTSSVSVIVSENKLMINQRKNGKDLPWILPEFENEEAKENREIIIPRIYLPWILPEFKTQYEEIRRITVQNNYQVLKQIAEQLINQGYVERY